MASQRSQVVVVPNELTIDKMVTLFVYVRYVCGWSLEQMEIRFEDEFLGTGIPHDIPDIDVRVKYNKRGYGSALEGLVYENRSVSTVPGMLRLVELFNKNNKTGYLKGYPFSLVWLIREMPRLPHNVSSREWRLEIVKLFWTVCEVYFMAAERDQASVAAMENPFTITEYSQLLDICTYLEDSRLTEFAEFFERAEYREDKAQDRAESITPSKVFTVRRMAGGDVAGHFIETDDDRVPRRYLHSHAEVSVLLTRKPKSGNYALFVRGTQNLKHLLGVLQRREPGLWDIPESGSQMLLNGSSTRAKKGSTQTPSQLIQLIQENVRFQTRSEGRKPVSQRK